MSQVRVLMVCTGNICRSPTAEGVLRHKLAEAGLDDRVTVDSAGTSDYHHGDPPDPMDFELVGCDLADFDDQVVDTSDCVLDFVIEPPFQ